MYNISLTEKYALCMLKEVKHFKHQDFIINLAMLMMLEMAKEGCLRFIDYNKGKAIKNTAKIKVELTDITPMSEYNHVLYNMIKAKSKSKTSISVFEIITKNEMEIDLKNLTPVISALKKSMRTNGLIDITKEKALIGTKEKITINKEAFTSIMTEIRKALLNDEPLEENMMALASFFKYSHLLKAFFLKYEKDILKRRKSEIKASKEYRVATMGYDIYNTVNTNIMIIMS